MNEKVAIYFYKNIIGQNKYLATSSTSSGQGVDMMFGQSKKEFNKKVPKLNLGTYLLIDGKIFKI